MEFHEMRRIQNVMNEEVEKSLQIVLLVVGRTECIIIIFKKERMTCLHHRIAISY